MIIIMYDKKFDKNMKLQINEFNIYSRKLLDFDSISKEVLNTKIDVFYHLIIIYIIHLYLLFSYLNIYYTIIHNNLNHCL